MSVEYVFFYLTNVYGCLFVPDLNLGVENLAVNKLAKIPDTVEPWF